MNASRIIHAAGAGAAPSASTPLSAQPGSATPPPPGLPPGPVTRVIAIGHVTENWTPEAIRTVMPTEVRETVDLYLQGHIDQWFMRKDEPGVVFVFNASEVAAVHDLLEALPLGKEHMMTFELIPVGPLAPLALMRNAGMRPN